MNTLTRLIGLLCVISTTQAVASFSIDSTTISLEDKKDSTFDVDLLSRREGVWTYQVEKVRGFDLSHWDLLIPSCIGHFSDYTSGAEIGKDGSIKDRNATGIKWNTTGGIFTFVLDANYPDTDVEVLTKAGAGYAVSTIMGPDCASAPIVEPPVTDNTPSVDMQPGDTSSAEPESTDINSSDSSAISTEPEPIAINSSDNSTVGDIAGDNETQSQWAQTWEGGFYGNDEVICTLDTNHSSMEKDWWQPQWITVSGWLQLHKEGYTGALKAKVITTGHVVNPLASVISELTKETVTCPSELPNCLGEEGKQSIVYKNDSYDNATGTITSDAEGRVEFTAKAWWPGISKGYLKAMDKINANDWDSVKKYVIENHYGMYLRGDGDTLLTRVGDIGSNPGKDIYWYPDNRCPKPAIDSYGELAVLANFDAYQMANGTVCLKWKTSMELDNAGFNILRAQHNASFTENYGYFNIMQINGHLISSKSSTSLSGESYAYVDSAPESGVLNHYGIEDIDFNQVRTIHLEFVTTPQPCQGEACYTCVAD